MSFPFARTEEALVWATEQLKQTTEPALAAKLLLAHVLECTLTHLFAHPEHTLTGDEVTRYHHLVTRRAAHEPVAYLVGHQAFLDLDLLVDRNVLIPRPETEVLVEATLHIAHRWPRPRIADVGTGSGAIAVALATHLPDAQIYALDNSSAALSVARRNASKYHLSHRIVFHQSDLLAALPLEVEQDALGSKPEKHASQSHENREQGRTKATQSAALLEIIVANLPYVSEAEYAVLPPDIRLYEPPEALVAGRDGLNAVRTLLETAPPYLTPDGVLLLEIGAAQGTQVAELAHKAFPAAHIEILPDYAHLDRVLCIRHDT